MDPNEQKKIWRREKEQMQQDKQVRHEYRPVQLSFGGTKKVENKPTPKHQDVWPADEILRRSIGYVKPLDTY